MAIAYRLVAFRRPTLPVGTPSPYVGKTWIGNAIASGLIHRRPATRWIPIFPELASATWKSVSSWPKMARSLSSNADTETANTNLRTTFTKIIKRAGETPWPKLFHNLRASQRDGAGGRLSDPRSLRVDRQHGSDSGQALPDRAGRGLPNGQLPKAAQKAAHPVAQKAGAAGRRRANGREIDGNSRKQFAGCDSCATF